MPLNPRFRRVAALERRFVDRVPVLQAFAEELKRVGEQPRVLNVTGVGGIGKSRLLRELRNRATASGIYRTAVLDLQVPAMRQPEDALAVLRSEFGKQKVRFDRFDIAYAVLWQRLHPNMKISSKDLLFVQDSEILTKILDDASGVPVFGTAMGLLQLADKVTSHARRRRTVKADEVLGLLDELETTEMLDAVTYLFAEDLRVASQQRPFVLFVDAYEALVPSPARTGRASASDAWLRDLIAQLGSGLVVVASREPLGWEAHDSEWGEVIHPCPVTGLPEESRLELLTEAGIVDAAEQRAIAGASQGLPFYLHLAIDTRTQSDRMGANVVSFEEIVQRFLHHVAPGEIRCLELLSIPRVFDFEIFKELSTAFELPRDRMTWESIIAYSFVYPAGETGQRLHQLMAAALRERLSDPVAHEAHLLLRGLWDRRAAEALTKVGALREAVYHGVRARAMPSPEILDYADRAVLRGGKQAIDGMVTDLGELLRTTPDPDLAETAQCLAAEAAIILGDAPEAGRLAASVPRSRLERPSGARLAMAAAHARRIAGDTAQAAGIYNAVWAHHPGPTRHAAGLWVADIHMWQGRFATAFAFARQVLASPDLGIEQRADVIRLLHLGHRFHLNLDSAAQALREARDSYQRAGSMVGLANVATNEVELWAWTDPASAVRAAPAALDAQQDLGALHELGKTHTALAVAQMRLGDAHAAAESFTLACDHLERARYRSGLARAELFRGFLHARQGDLGQSLASFSWAVSELVAAEVYPNLIITADLALQRLGATDPDVTSAAVTARAQVEPLDSIAAFETRTVGLIAAMLGDDTTLGEGS